MKYKLETIPLWDAIEDQGSDCPFCLLMRQKEERTLDYYLGSSVMNPETRVKVNTIGFCPDHYQALSERSKPQALALIAHTHLEQTTSGLSAILSRLSSSRSRRRTSGLIKEMESYLSSRERGCLVCSSMTESLQRYLFTFVHLWDTDRNFLPAIEASNGLCLHHMQPLLKMALEVLDASRAREFFSMIESNMNRWLQSTSEDVHWMTQMYKSENSDKEWNGCEQAHRRAVNREVGRGRIRREN